MEDAGGELNPNRKEADIQKRASVEAQGIDLVDDDDAEGKPLPSASAAWARAPARRETRTCGAQIAGAPTRRYGTAR